MGIIAGLITGFSTTILWSTIDFLQEIITERFTSFIFAFIITIIVSSLEQRKSNGI